MTANLESKLHFIIIVHSCKPAWVGDMWVFIIMLIFRCQRYTMGTITQSALPVTAQMSNIILMNGTSQFSVIGSSKWEFA